MKRSYHVSVMSKTPVVAQSNFQIKLDSSSLIIDTLLLVPRQQPWKATPYIGGTDTGGGGVEPVDGGGGGMEV